MVAGLTSTGKTRLVEEATRNLQDQGYDAVLFLRWEICFDIS